MPMNLWGTGKSPYVGTMSIAMIRKMEDSFVTESHLLQDGRVSLKIIKLSFTQFHPVVMVLRFKLLDNLDLVAKESELTPQDPLKRTLIFNSEVAL